ncbi:MAG: glycosyl hydrolase 108 family protein [Rikenellaceae bacterium]
MASVDILAPFILSFEGGYVDHPCDRGGATNKGVTISTWRACGYDKTGDGVVDSCDLKLLSDTEVIQRVLKPHYWDRCQGDEIEDQSVANILVDWVWASGVWGIKHTQRILGVESDGVIGERSLRQINCRDAHDLFDKIKSRREQHFRSIVERDPSQSIFLRGWLRRLGSIKYGALELNGDV